MRIATAEIVFVRPVMKFWHTNRVALTTGGAPSARRIMQRVPSARRVPGIAMNAVKRMPRPQVVRITGIVRRSKHIIRPPTKRIAITPGIVRITRRHIHLTKVAKTVTGTAQPVLPFIIRRNRLPVTIIGIARPVRRISSTMRIATAEAFIAQPVPTSLKRMPTVTITGRAQAAKSIMR
jgi:hypothetical protein